MILKDYVAPQTREEADRRRDELVIAIQDMQQQMANRNKLGPDGRRLEEHEYWSWRNKARIAHLARLEELRRIKAWIREDSSRPTATSDEGQVLLATAGQHFGALCIYVKRLEARVRELEQEKAALEELPEGVG